MRLNVNIKFLMLLMTAALFCGLSSAQAQRRPYHRHHCTVKVVKRPCIVHKCSYAFCQKERHAIAIAYMRNKKYLTVKHYAKMTGLKKKMAEAELDMFASSKRSRIAIRFDKKKKLYYLR